MQGITLGLGKGGREVEVCMPLQNEVQGADSFEKRDV